ncbi:MAG: hypothetical protein E8D48_03455 [Nitrospira sp.]|nr:MAG: hypothetical protein E8D48_03455 [Nitrospira sp.]
MLRGGSWNNEPDNVRSANRNRNTPTNRNDNIGFRCAQDACSMAGVRTFTGKIRSVPLGVQADPGLLGVAANSRRTHCLHFGPAK